MKLTGKIKRYFNKFLGLFPSPLPVGMTEFNAWVDSIADTYDLPGSYRDQKYTLAALVIRMGESTAYKPKLYFALALHSAAAKQIAGAQYAQIRQELIDEQEKAKTLTEATVTVAVASNESSKVQK